MTATLEHEAIKRAFEDGMSIEDIASDRGMEVSVVKAALTQVSTDYRKQVNSDGNDGLDFSDDDMRQVVQQIKTLALNAESEELRAKCAMYIRDDKKGRKEVRSLIQHNQFNLLEFNENLRSSREKMRSIVDVAA